jgi:hypothetical protein|tara:strand:- start:186 stop:614 length:429 start_codon:yes stop_codon:yes gene_type:complete
MYAVKAALLTKLQADISDVQITYGDSGGAMRRESIFMGDIESNTQTPEAFASGRRRLIEDYTVDVHVAVQSKAAGLQEAEERAVALATSVENVVNDYPTLSGAVTGLMFIECSGLSMSSAEAGVDGPRVFVTVHVHVKGKLV